MKFIGLDLAWSSSNTTGGAIIEYKGEGKGKLVSWQEKLGSNDEILQFVNEAAPASTPALIAIDAPLAVPNSIGARDCDLELSRVFRKYEAGTHPANRTNLGRYGQPFGDIRGETLAQRLVEELNFRHDPHLIPQQDVRQFFECYPHPAMIVIFGLEKTLKYKRKLRNQENDRHAAYARLQSLLGSLVGTPHFPCLEIPPELLQQATQNLKGANLKHYEDLLDGIMCAYIAFYHWWWGAEKTQIFGSVASGHIVTPRLVVSF